MVIIKKTVQPYSRSKITEMNKWTVQIGPEEMAKTAKDPYEDWIMPEEQSGYIKSKKNDSL